MRIKVISLKKGDYSAVILPTDDVLLLNQVVVAAGYCTRFVWLFRLRQCESHFRQGCVRNCGCAVR